MQAPRARSLDTVPAILLATVLAGCGSSDGGGDPPVDSGTASDGGDDGLDAGAPDAEAARDGGEDRTCEAASDVGCFEINRGESRNFRWIDDYPTFEFDDEGTARTVIHLDALVDSEVVADPENWRYQIYGTDGYTFGGFATWENISNGYLEVGTRRVVFDPSQELPRGYRVRDAYLMVLSPDQ